MPYKMLIYKRYEDKGIIYKVPLRNVTVSEAFVGVGKKGQPIHTEFMELAKDLEPGHLGLAIDVINI